MKQIIECVPNFSEGRDLNIIRQITDEIEKVEGVRLLDVDPGQATNRTVVTFVGEPEPVIEAAVRAARKATELIDMSKHKGAHPRFGAMDVCPLVPVANVTMEETANYARKLAERLGNELKYPIYCYENAAFKPERVNLANVRKGEYEGLQEKLSNPEWKPDFGPAEFIPHIGASAVSARDFLVAINYNLNTTSTRRANAIAFDVREKGRPKREGNPITGKIVKDEKGNPVNIPGTLKATKAIGWFIEEYGIAQVSMNITNISTTPVHIAFDEVCEKAMQRGVRVSGAEIVGLVPKKVLIEAGKHYLIKQQRSVGVSESELIKIAVKSMGLDDLKPFNPQEKIIEYLLDSEDKTKKLVDFSVKSFAEETASESPAPGGGSISAYMGALGAALGTMVANLSSHKPGWDERWSEFGAHAEEGQKIMEKLLWLVDEDTLAFNKIMDAFGLPKNSEEEKLIRKKAIQEATKYATQVPFRTMQESFLALPLCLAMAEKGNPNSVSDAGVGALAIVAGIKGAHLNVKINAAGIEDKNWASELLKEAEKIENEAVKMENKIMEIVNKIILG